MPATTCDSALRPYALACWGGPSFKFSPGAKLVLLVDADIPLGGWAYNLSWKELQGAIPLMVALESGKELATDV
jgi:hypothetical protein